MQAGQRQFQFPALAGQAKPGLGQLLSALVARLQLSGGVARAVVIARRLTH
jgi:hypothetical protein